MLILGCMKILQKILNERKLNFSNIVPKRKSIQWRICKNEIIASLPDQAQELRIGRRCRSVSGCYLVL